MFWYSLIVSKILIFMLPSVFAFFQWGFISFSILILLIYLLLSLKEAAPKYPLPSKLAYLHHIDTFLLYIRSTPSLPMNNGLYYTYSHIFISLLPSRWAAMKEYSMYVPFSVLCHTPCRCYMSSYISQHFSIASDWRHGIFNTDVVSLYCHAQHAGYIHTAIAITFFIAALPNFCDFDNILWSYYHFASAILMLVIGYNTT